jgi:hypothetical protein
MRAIIVGTSLALLGRGFATLRIGDADLDNRN